ncbi:MAG: hypothetical protein ACYSUI_21545, partial [Planctomycetota bacterium]
MAVLAVLLAIHSAWAGQPSRTLTLKLTRGGEVFGEVLDATDDLIVLDYRGVPCAFAYDELEVASAYQAKKHLLARDRGGPHAL